MTATLVTLAILTAMYLGYKLGMWNEREARREYNRHQTTEG